MTPQQHHPTQPQPATSKGWTSSTISKVIQAVATIALVVVSIRMLVTVRGIESILDRGNARRAPAASTLAK